MYPEDEGFLQNYQGAGRDCRMFCRAPIDFVQVIGRTCRAIYHLKALQTPADILQGVLQRFADSAGSSAVQVDLAKVLILTLQGCTGVAARPHCTCCMCTALAVLDFPLDTSLTCI